MGGLRQAIRTTTIDELTNKLLCQAVFLNIRTVAD